MKKIIATFLIVFALFNIANAQPDWTGPNLQIGYRWGTVGANIVQLSDLNNANSSLVNQKVRFNNSYLEVKYNRISKHVYYDVDLSGVILSFDNLIRNKYVEDRAIKNYVPIAKGRFIVGNTGGINSTCFYSKISRQRYSYNRMAE